MSVGSGITQVWGLNQILTSAASVALREVD